MKRLLIERVVKIRVGFAWTDWDLYDVPGVVLVAQELNETLMWAVNGGMSRFQVMAEMGTVMHKNDLYGTLDSEPQEHLRNVLVEIFGDY